MAGPYAFHLRRNLRLYRRMADQGQANTMTCTIAFIAGLIIGGIIGLVILAALVVAGEDDWEERLRQGENDGR